MTTVTEVAASPAADDRPRADVLRRADGIELIGEFQGSGFREPPKLARRADAQAADGRRDVHAVAAAVSERQGRTVTPQNIGFLAQEKLRPLGVLALAD